MKLQRPIATALATVLACLLAASAAHAEIKIAVIQELSGQGATAGTNFKNGVELAVKEINAAGGILGQKLDAAIEDTQSNPGIAKGLALGGQKVFVLIKGVTLGSGHLDLGSVEL